MAKFAEGTTTPIAYSKTEIEKLVARFGATKFMVATDDESNTAAIQFLVKGRMIRLTLTLVDPAVSYGEQVASADGLAWLDPTKC